jgi:hypothetical protein
MLKKLDILAVIHYGNHDESGKVVDDKCPCCKWDPLETPEGKICNDQSNHRLSDNNPDWYLGEIWKPSAERGIGAYFQVLHCQGCWLVYATHLN